MSVIVVFQAYKKELQNFLRFPVENAHVTSVEKQLKILSFQNSHFTSYSELKNAVLNQGSLEITIKSP